MILLELNTIGAVARRLGVVSTVLCVFMVSSHAAPVLDRTKCLNAPTQDCVFALALEESEILHLDRMFPRRNIPDEKKAQWREELKDPARKEKWKKFFWTYRGYKIVAAEQAEAGLLDRALDTAQVVGLINKKMAVWSLRDIVERLARKGDFAGIERVFAQIEDESARMRTGEAIVNEALKANLTERAAEFLTKLEPQTERVRLLRSLAFELAARGDHSDARRTAALAETFLQGASHHPAHGIRYLINLGEIDAAQKEIDQNPDANLYVRSGWAQALAIHYAKEGDVEKADAYLAKVDHPKLHVEATVEIPALLAVADVFFVLPSLQASELASGDPFKAADPNPMYREDAACIREPTADCLFDMAVKKAAEPHPVWMIGQIRASNEYKAKKLRRVEESDEYKRGYFAVPRRFAKVAVCFARAGRVDDALNAIEQHVSVPTHKRFSLRLRDIPRKTLIDVVIALARNGNVGGVRQASKYADSRDSRIEVLRFSGIAAADANQTGTAEQIIEMIEAVSYDDYPEVVPDDHSEFTSDEHLEFAPSSKAAILGRIVSAQVRAGKRDVAQKTIDEMIAIYSQLQNVDLHLLVSALLELGDLKRARQVEAKYAGAHLLSKEQSTEAFVRFFAHQGDSQAAIREADKFERFGTRRTVLYQIPAQVYAGTKDFDAALALIPVVGAIDDNRSNQASAVGAIAREIARAGNVAATLKLIGGMADEMRQRSAYSSAAAVFAKAGNVEAAELLIAKGNVRVTWHTEIPLITAIARSGKIHDAIRRSLDYPVGIVIVEGLCSTAVEMASSSSNR